MHFSGRKSVDISQPEKCIYGGPTVVRAAEAWRGVAARLTGFVTHCRYLPLNKIH